MNSKQIIFSIIIFIFFYLNTLLAFLILNKNNISINQILVIGGFSLVMSILLIVMYKLLKINDTNNSKDSFDFRVTPEKLCDGGPYMWGSGEKLKLCSELVNNKKDYLMYNCPLGLYNGRPVQFEYTPQSDKNWLNKSCDNSILTNNEMPYVL